MEEQPNRLMFFKNGIRTLPTQKGLGQPRKLPKCQSFEARDGKRPIDLPIWHDD
jgi:hypothetical protein